MWEGEMTQELKELYDEYERLFGCYPDEYIDFYVSELSYDEYVEKIKYCIDNNLEFQDLYELGPEELF